MSHIEKLRAAGGQINTARLTGGGSRSPVWSQMFADTIEVPMEVSDGNEIGARGAAISAGIGAGIYSNYAEAIREAVSVVRVHEPNPANKLFYLERYAEYQRLARVMQAPWEALSKLG
jgi:L-xylulokinase